MVYLKVKKSEDDLFLFEAKHDQLMEEVIRECALVHNQRVRLKELIHHVKDLVQYGPMRPPEKQGLEDDMSSLQIEDVTDEDLTSKGKEVAVTDPSARRVGVPPPKVNAEEISDAVSRAESVLDKHVEKKEGLTLAILKDLFADISGSITKAYISKPLPAYDPITEYLFDDFKSEDYLDPNNSTMWFAGKELYGNTKLMDIKSVGKNDKSVIIVKLQKRGGGAPARESGITAEMQKNMLSYYYKKQEEEKKLLEDADDSYVNSAWANPGSLKSHFQGIKNVSWK